MSAVEALAEVLLDAIIEPYAVPCPTCGAAIWQSCSNDAMHSDSHATREADAVVAAIRSMPAEQVAELIGGTVCYGHGHALPFIRSTGVNRLVPEGTNEFTRVVTPWLPLGVSPETNGEQK